MMGAEKNRGFTIIEVTLFLGISGVLIAGILLGATRNINNQRYRDTVEQTRNVIQGQYDRVYSLTNDDVGEAGNINPCSEVPQESHRGTTNCLYVGRLIEVRPSDRDDAETEVRLSPIIAMPQTADGTLPPLFGAADTSAAQATSGRSNGANPIEGYTVRPHTANEQLIETRSLDWGLRVVRPGGEEHQPFSMVILRSPVNGALSTHMVAREMMDTDRADLDGIINGETVPEATLCIIEPAGMFGFAGVVTRMAVTIDASAVGPGGVRSVGEAESGC